VTTYRDLVGSYLADPTPATLAELRGAVRSARNFRSDLPVAEIVHPLMERGTYDEAISALQDLMPGAMFSPSAHSALAEALTRTGRQEAAYREVALARAAIRSILSTGDGTAERPWSVLRISDEYDVLRSLRKRPREQSVVQDGDRYLDRHVCEDGSDDYFDVTELFPRN
jgi:hypothetical protein